MTHLLPEGNWHAIEGPNGLCACGSQNGVCGDRLREHVEALFNQALTEAAGALPNTEKVAFSDAIDPNAPWNLRALPHTCDFQERVREMPRPDICAECRRQTIKDNDGFVVDKRAKGLYRKFSVTRTDGQSGPGQKHDGCEYFVLDVTHDPHAKAALMAYADSCEADCPLLARDLRLKGTAALSPDTAARKAEG